MVPTALDEGGGGETGEDGDLQSDFVGLFSACFLTFEKHLSRFGDISDHYLLGTLHYYLDCDRYPTLRPAFLPAFRPEIDFLIEDPENLRRARKSPIDIQTFYSAIDDIVYFHAASLVCVCGVESFVSGSALHFWCPAPGNSCGRNRPYFTNLSRSGAVFRCFYSSVLFAL